MTHKFPEILQKRYSWTKNHSADQCAIGTTIEFQSTNKIDSLSKINSLADKLHINISYIQSWDEFDGVTHMTIQTDQSIENSQFFTSLKEISSLKQIQIREDYNIAYGKRVIIMGGGAQVSQVATGAITEADRHNIRGETISVDTIARVGEIDLAKSIRAVGRLHRAAILVLAGALMGGEITKAVKELRHTYGIPVISLKMAGSVNKVSDLVISDPLQAGVMSVMLISHVGSFNLLDLKTFQY